MLYSWIVVHFSSVHDVQEFQQSLGVIWSHS
jgi:hypothetical protein